MFEEQDSLMPGKNLISVEENITLTFLFHSIFDVQDQFNICFCLQANCM